MSITYMCRHCKQEIGKIEQDIVTSAMLGFDQLTSEERSRIIQYELDGGVRINVICDHCETSLNEHPNYHELDYFIH